MDLISHMTYFKPFQLSEWMSAQSGSSVKFSHISPIQVTCSRTDVLWIKCKGSKKLFICLFNISFPPSLNRFQSSLWFLTCAACVLFFLSRLHLICFREAQQNLNLQADVGGEVQRGGVLFKCSEG